MMPRPSSQAQTRLTMLRVNQGFFGVISQSAKTSRGSRSGGNWILVPSGKDRVCGSMAGRRHGAPLATAVGFAPLAGFSGATLAAGALVWSGSQKTCSSFHSRVGL